MPQYEVTYFNIRAKAEVMRILLSLAGQEFVDKRVDGEQWQKLKPNTHFGKLPILTVDGVEISQSLAGARYLAREYGYHGSTSMETAQIDMIVDCMEDIVNPFFNYNYEKNETIKTELKKRHEESIPERLQKLEKLLSDANGEYFVGNKLSLADIHVTHFLDFLGVTIDLHLEKFPKLKSLKSRVENLPKVREWLQKRPATKL